MNQIIMYYDTDKHRSQLSLKNEQTCFVDYFEFFLKKTKAKSSATFSFKHLTLTFTPQFSHVPEKSSLSHINSLKKHKTNIIPQETDLSET